MNFFNTWAFAGGIFVIISYCITTFGSEFITYNSFVVVLSVWLILGIYVVYDLVKSMRSSK